MRRGSCGSKWTRATSESPILYPLGSRTRLVLDLQPRPAAAVLVRRIAPFRHDALEAELAGVREHGRAGVNTTGRSLVHSRLDSSHSHNAGLDSLFEPHCG